MSRLGIQIARAIIAGDVDMARRLVAMGPRYWSVAECRAVAGACIVAGLAMPDGLKKGLMSYARAFPWLPQFGNGTQANIKRSYVNPNVKPEAFNEDLAELRRVATAVLSAENGDHHV